MVTAFNSCMIHLVITASAVNSAVCQEQGFGVGAFLSPVEALSLPQCLSSDVTENRPDGVQTCVGKGCLTEHIRLLNIARKFEGFLKKYLGNNLDFPKVRVVAGMP